MRRLVYRVSFPTSSSRKKEEETRERARDQKKTSKNTESLTCISPSLCSADTVPYIYYIYLSIYIMGPMREVCSSSSWSFERKNGEREGERERERENERERKKESVISNHNTSGKHSKREYLSLPVYYPRNAEHREGAILFCCLSFSGTRDIYRHPLFSFLVPVSFSLSFFPTGTLNMYRYTHAYTRTHVMILTDFSKKRSKQ